ncbi:MAG: hypothetical protein CMF36_04130 [Leeuwenhoekiella sp.]|nr:hypothetical protein [Leeuwenhoekiella sp.]
MVPRLRGDDNIVLKSFLMKILTIYINGVINHLSIQMIDYLIDAGHNVILPHSLAAVRSKKLAHHTHNMFVLEQEQIIKTPVYYQLIFNNETELDNIPSIKLGVYEEAQYFHLASYIEVDGQLFKLCCENTNEVLDHHVVELFTDSIIQLSKYGHQDLSMVSLKTNNLFWQLIDYHSKTELLDDFYKQNQHQELLFSLPKVNEPEFTHYRNDSSFDWSQPNIVEWFTLYLLAQLNSRKTSIYCYDYFVDDKGIKKYIDINQQDTFNTIQARINNECYNLIQNPFYRYNSQANHCAMVLINSNDCCQTSLQVKLDQSNRLSICYDKSLYLLNQIKQFSLTFRKYWQDFKDGKITFYQLLNSNAAQIYEQCKTFNPASTPVPDQTIDVFFEQQVKLQGEQIAIECVDGSFTYEALNVKTNQLAHYLSQQIEQPNRLIGIYLDRTSSLIMSMLAILKSGHAYIPLDTNIPDERLSSILTDCKPVLVLTNQALQNRLNTLSNPVKSISLDNLEITNTLNDLPVTNLEKKHTPKDLAYVIYTSGTTGKPKGVMIEHQALANTLTYFQSLTELNPSDRLLAVTTMVFDIAVLEIFMPLMTGCTVIFMPREDILDIAKLISVIEKKAVSIMQATPSLWSLISQELGEQHLPIRVLCGGEALPLSLAKQLKKQVAKIWNVYGPTETTIWSTVYQYQGSDLFIGKPIANTHCYVLDDQLNLLPVGAVGELYIGGQSLARGYYEQDELTKKTFIDKHRQPSLAFKACDRLYKTGDLVCYTEDGLLAFFGRNDFQVKIRGHRIELSDIEHALLSINEVTQAVTVVKSLHDDANDLGNVYLLGYYVSEQPLDENEMMQHLKGVLPDYMCPNVLIHLEEMPLSINGKINRKQLPVPALSHALQQAPRDQIEEKLCALFKVVLNLPQTHRANIYDDFFNLGGNSILGIKLVNDINRQLSSDINIRDLFFDKSIINIAKKVKESKGKFALKEYMIATSDLENLYQEFPMTNVQQTYYLGRFDYFELSNVSTHVYTEFKYQCLDVSRLEKAFNVLLQRHLALRTVFTESTQRFLKEAPYYQIVCHYIESEQDLYQIREQYSHKVYQPHIYPLFDIVASRHKHYYLLHISFDAIIVDMSSFEILFAELIQLYQDINKPLPVLSLQFRDYVIQHETIRSGDLFKQAESYWLNKLDDYYLEMKLPLTMYPSQVSHPQFKRLSKTIKQEKWQIIKDKAQQVGVSLTAVIVEVFGRVLAYWSNQQKLAINLTLFNRLPIHEQVNQVIGDFTALELFAYVKKQTSIKQILEETHQRLLTDIEHNLFDGIDFQRLLRQHHQIPANSVVSPVVLTSVLGGSKQSGLFNLPLNDGYQGIEYAISQTAQVWLDNKAYEDDDGFVAEWDYVSQLFDEHVITTMHESYCYLIESLATLNWATALFPHLQMSAKDQAVIAQANNASRPVSEDTMISAYESLLGQSNLAAGIAVVDDEQQQRFSHQQLWQDTERLGKQLVQRQSNGLLIGVLSEKGYNLPLATLSILRAGHAYLPLHVDWPSGRIDEVLKQGGVDILLVSAKVAQQTERMAGLKEQYRILIIEDMLGKQAADIALPTVKADDIAYVIFTSGSTGKPKGVTISHRGALNTIAAVNEAFNVNEADSILALSELSFDLSVYDIFGLLIAGGTIVYPQQSDSKEPQAWLRLIKGHQVTLWNTAPQLAGLLADEPGADISTIRVYLLSGDWIPVSLPDKLKQLSANTQVISLGGATEGSIWSIWYPIESVDPQASSIPYGYAMPNQKMYVLNEGGQHCPVGVMGEIHIGGMGVAVNYWGNEDITAKQFFHHPKLGRLYKTGDLGRWHHNGYIEFCGRADFQVKINGYRVELEEIKNKLEQIKGIDEAFVVIQKNQERQYLTAHLYRQTQSNKEHQVDEEQFKLAQHGLIKQLNYVYQSPQDIDEARLRKHKSYREFSGDAIDRHYLSDLIEKATQPPTPAEFSNNLIQLASFHKILKAISAKQLEARVLPKYPYPSGGSAYAVRCYCHQQQDVYYYHPVDHGFAKTDLVKSIGSNAIDLVIHWPAVKPLYGDHAYRLAVIEAGHMAQLLTKSLNDQQQNWQLEILDQSIDSENTLIARILLVEKPVAFDLTVPKIKIATHEGKYYLDEDGEQVIDLANQSLFTQASPFGKMLKTAQAMICFTGGQDAEHYFKSGFILQSLSDDCYEHHIGYCTLGYIPNNEVVYCALFGKIKPELLSNAESQEQAEPLQQVIQQQLENQLPDYMIPQAYAVIDTLPLSPNGKLALNLLPDIEIERDYEAPINEQETELALLLAEVLGITPAEIGRHDDFFSLGGNSLMAIQAVRQLNQSFDLALKLTDFYQSNTIAQLAESIIPIEETREEGVL